MATNQISSSPYLLSDANQAAYRYNGELPPEESLEQQALNRKQHIANLLIQQGLAGAGTNRGQMVGRFYVPGSPVQGLADIAKIGVGAYGSHLNDQSRGELADTNKQMLADALANYKQGTSDVPAVPGSGPTPGPQAAVADAMTRFHGIAPASSPDPSVFSGNYPMGPDESGWEPKGPIQDQNAAPAMPAPQQAVAQAMAPQPMQGPVSPGTAARARTPEEKRQALIDLMASPHPQARQIGTILEKQEADATERTANREFLKTEKGLDRENRLATAQGQMGQNILLATMAGASKETIQAMKDSNDKLIQEMRGKSAEHVATIGADARVDAAGMKAGAGKTLPGSIGGKFMENSQNLRMAERAKALIEGQTVEGAKGDPNATGMKGYLPDMLTQRMDPSGVETRAAVANLGSMIIHDRSGAAVTASEYPRLKPFIPAATDDPATVKKKLGQFIHEYNKINDEMTQFYTESGYNVPSSDWHKSPETTVPTTQGKPNAFQPFHDPDEEKAYQQWKLEHK